MKYIRTENKIYKICENGETYNGFGCKTEEGTIKIHKKDILKQADTIEELIMPGDLVRYDGLCMSWIEKDRGNQVRGIDMHLIDRKSVCDLWIPVGNDPETHPDFKLIASKDNDEGELELL